MKGIKKNKGIIIGILLVLIFSFFMGFYASYRINEKQPTKLEIIKRIMEEEWYYGIDEDDIEASLEDKMILSMLDLQKDPFTRYLVSLGSLADTYTGIGITIGVYGEYFIVNDINSESALNSGIKVNDIIINIDGISVSNKSLADISEMVKDKSKVRVQVARDEDFANLIEIEMNVSSYNPLTVYTKEYANQIAYVRISEFNLDTATYLDQYFSTLSDERGYKLILDLRGNPGGYISAVKDVLDLFVSKNKEVLTTVEKNGNTSKVTTSSDACYLFHEIVVMIDENSASGAEALSAALNYHLNNLVTLYGNTTYGKGSAQKTYYFEDGTYFHYTYALWNTPSGKTINHLGVKPEVFDVNEGISSLTMYDKELDLYDYGQEVLSVQKFLKILGYYNGDLHSFMDVNTVEALKNFQEAYNLEETGKVDSSTLRYISKMIYDDSVVFKSQELDRVIGRLSHE